MDADFFILMKTELSVLFILFLLLFLKIWDGIKNSSALLNLINILLFANFIFGFFYNKSGELFNGMFYTDEIIALEKNILNIGVLTISLQASNWIKTHKHLLEFYILLLSTLVGLFYMISSKNFLMFYLGLELSSIPLAALINFDIEKRSSSEAAIKMIFSSAFASGIMLFGISLLYGTTGSLSFVELQHLIQYNAFDLLSIIFIFSGFAFKLSIVPFHFWTADVYEGAPVSVTSFLSVISKAAIVFVFISVLFPLFSNIPKVWYGILFLATVFTISIGNLFAIRQNNIKRFLAYSSIAQVGYILLGLSSGDILGVVSSVYFLIVYLFSNLGVFGIIALVSNQTGKENIDDYKGFYKSNKFLAWIISIALFSLAGIPPTAGFFGKMFLITSGASAGNFLLVGFAALNMVISLYYYLRIIKAIFMDENSSPLPKIIATTSAKIGLSICFFGIIVTGFASLLYEYIINIFSSYF